MSNKSWFRRFTVSFVLALATLLLVAAPLFACEITIKPEKSSGQVGDIIKLDITVVLTHRNCPVPMSDTKFITSSNLAIVGQTAWVSAGRDTYKTVLTVQLLAAGTAKLEIVRDCIKEGGYEVVTLTAGGTAVIDTPVTTNIPREVSPGVVVVPSTSSIGGDTVEPASEMTWLEAFKRAFSQPFIWAYLGLTFFAYFALLFRRRRWRYISLAFSMVYLGFFLGLCPCVIGAMQNVLLHLGDPKQYLAHFIILAVPILSTVFLGRLYCGWVCPMGAVQQFLYRRDLSVKLPAWVGDKLRWLRFGILIAIISAALYTGTEVFAEIDPFKSLFNAQISPVPTTFLVILVVASIFIFTPWCRFLCPMGAVLSVVGRIARRELSFKPECKNCGACAKTFCEYKAITPGSVLPKIEQHECARCGECISRCPKNAMEYEIPDRKSNGSVSLPQSPVLRHPIPERVVPDPGD